MKLDQLQRSFQAHVLRADAAIAGEIVGAAGYDIALRLAVYTDAYSARLVEVLAETYPAVQAAVGTQRFARLIGKFVKEHPSPFRSARDYGAQLEQWARTHLSGPQGRGISDLARFEWAVAGAFDAADCEALKAAALAAFEPTQWPQLRFGFSPTVRRVAIDSNAVSFWKSACADQARPGRWRDTCTQQWLIWRQELAVFYRRLPQAEVRALDAARSGRSFGELCEALSAPQAAVFLQRWFSDGLLTGVALGAL